MTVLNITQAALVLGISTATLRNWLKAGYVETIELKPLRFNAQSITHLKQQLDSGIFAKLDKRANKQQLKKQFIPKEYAANKKILNDIALIVNTTRTYMFDIETIMLAAVWHILKQANEVSIDDSEVLVFKRAQLEQEYNDWQAALKHRKVITVTQKEIIDELFQSLSDFKHGDTLGLLYQSLCNTGDKSTQGAFYTSTELIIDALTALQAEPQKSIRFLDPCCGTGNYLRHAATHLALQPTHIYGFDLDPIAVRIARINLLLMFPEHNFNPHIYCLDFLKTTKVIQKIKQLKITEGIDVIASNPPWGAYKSSNDELLPFNTKETFALFIYQAINVLKPNGKLSFILPEAILNTQIHAPIRKFLLDNTHIINIVQLGSAFTGVFTAAIRLDVIKKLPEPLRLKWETNIITQGHIKETRPSYKIDQQRFVNNPHYEFDIQTQEFDAGLLQKIYSVPHTTLANNSAWALGIVTGNNKTFLANAPSPQHYKAILRGTDILPFVYKTPCCFLNYQPEKLQQAAKPSLYFAQEKLIYRFVSKKLIVAYDNQQTLTLNSANIVIPQLPQLSIKVILAYLNSQVIQYVFTKKFSTIKVLKQHLCALPLPLISVQKQNEIEHLVDSILAGDCTKRVLLESVIFEIFRLVSTEIEVISNLINDNYCT